MENLSIAAKLLMVSGKIPGLNQGLSFYEAPSREKVNARLLAAYLIAATVEYLKNTGSLEYSETEIPAIMGKIPVLVLRRLSLNGIGFEKIMLEKLDAEKNLIDLVKSIIGGVYQMPEYQVLWLIRKEFPSAEFMRQEKVKTLIFSRMETRWIPEKVTPLIDAWYPGLAPVWDATLRLPWLQTAVRDCNFAFSSTTAQPKRD